MMLRRCIRTTALACGSSCERRPWRVAAASMVALLSAPPAAAQQFFPSDSVIRAEIGPQLQAGERAGIVIGLIEPDGTRRIVSIGRDGPIYEAHTLFEIGSVTKAFTGILLAEMVERGVVRFDSPVASLLPPGTRVPERAGRPITLLDLATQSSGLPRLPDNMRPLVRARILEPLGMESTTIALDSAARQRLAPGHNALGQVVPNWDLPTLAGAGALRSSVDDMRAFVAANLDPPDAPLGRAISDGAAARALTRVPRDSPVSPPARAPQPPRASARCRPAWHTRAG